MFFMRNCSCVSKYYLSLKNFLTKENLCNDKQLITNKTTNNGLFILHINKQYSQITNQELHPRKEEHTKILKIAIIGMPNSGKSTFINQIVGRKVFAMSNKVHTTRARARAVLNLDDTQVVFLDTPGLVTQTESDKYKLEHTFVRDGELSMTESNVIGVIHDLENRFTRGKLDRNVLRLLHLYSWKHTVLILNKVDTVKKKNYLLELADRLTYGKLRDTHSIPSSLSSKKYSEEELLKVVKNESGWPNFSQVFMVSALEGQGIGEVMQYFLKYSKPGKWVYSDSVYTDLNPQELLCNTVKGKLLDLLPHEVPYKCNVKLELYHKNEDGTISAVLLIICPTVKYEKLIKRKIRSIAIESEEDLRSAFMTDVQISLQIQTVD